MLRNMLLLLQLALLSNLALAGTHVCIEAESSTNIVSLMQIGAKDQISTNKAWSAVAGASAEKYIEIPQASVTNVPAKTEAKVTPPLPGKVSYDIQASDSGPHQLWCRVWWLDTCGNSVSIGVDGQRAFSFGQDRTFKRWHWVKAPARLKQLTLSEGTHSIVISAREDGIRVDQILLTDDEDYVPVGIEDITQP